MLFERMPILPASTDSRAGDDILEPPKLYNNRTSTTRRKSAAEGPRKHKGQRAQIHLSDDEDLSGAGSTHIRQSHPSARPKGRPRGSKNTCSACGVQGHKIGTVACKATGQRLIEAREEQQQRQRSEREAEKERKRQKKKAAKDEKEREKRAAKQAKNEQKEKEKQRRNAEKKGEQHEKKAVRVNKGSDKVRSSPAKRPRTDDKENQPPSGALGPNEHHYHNQGMLLDGIRTIHDEAAVAKLKVTLPYLCRRRRVYERAVLHTRAASASSTTD